MVCFLSYGETAFVVSTKKLGDAKMAKMKSDESRKKPLRKFKVGRFQISIWKFTQLLSNGGKESTSYVEQWVDIERACVQYSTYNKANGQWENQSIWCAADDLRNLASVVDKFNELEDGEEDSSSSSLDEHRKLLTRDLRRRQRRRRIRPFRNLLFRIIMGCYPRRRRFVPVSIPHNADTVYVCPFLRVKAIIPIASTAVEHSYTFYTPKSLLLFSLATCSIINLSPPSDGRLNVESFARCR